SSLCIECDACVDVCPVSCLTITGDGAEPELRTPLSAPALNLTQDLYVSDALPQTKRVTVTDEQACLHCGLCAERCPTAAWDMLKFELHIPYAGRSAMETKPKAEPKPERQPERQPEPKPEAKEEKKVVNQ